MLQCNFGGNFDGDFDAAKVVIFVANFKSLFKPLIQENTFKTRLLRNNILKFTIKSFIAEFIYFKKINK